MKVISKKVENSQAFLTIELEPAEVEDSLEESYRRLVKKTNVPGFRRGKAPRGVLEQHIGKESLLEDALNSLLPKACADAVKEHNIEAIARPVIEVTQTDPVVFKATVPLPPTVRLGNYQQIGIKPEPVKLKKDDVNAIIEQMRHQQATWEPVERPVEVNDLVVIDIDSSIGDKPFISDKGANFQVLSGMSLPAPGFAEQLLGMTRDEEKEFRLKLPEKYYASDQVGKEALFKVKVTEVKEEVLPELNDDFAKGFRADTETVGKLRKWVSGQLRQRAEEKAMIDFEDQVVDTVIKKSEVEFPPILVDTEVDRMVEQQLERWRRTTANPEEYRDRLNRTPVEELRKEYQPVATQRVTTSLVLGEVARAEKIEVSDSEIDAEVERMTENAGPKKEEQEKFFSNPQVREQVKQMLTTQKTVQRLVEIAKGSYRATKKKGKEAK